MPTTHPLLPLTIRPSARGRKFTIELDRNRMERLAANLGLFRPEFLASLERAERDITQKKVKRLRSLRDLRGS